MRKSILLPLICVLFMACNNNTDNKAASDNGDSSNLISSVTEESVDYSDGGKTYKNFVYYNKSNDSVRPVVLVIPEWWGLTEYPKMRAKQLAELGYIAMAVDMYGNGELGEDPKRAQELATPFYKDPSLAYNRINAALDQMRKHRQADTSRMAAIGYCFGGSAVLNAANLGAGLDGVVSFHGDFPQGAVDKNKFTADVLIAHGADDKMVSDSALNAFKQKLDAAGIRNIVKSYPGATHAFTNPDATETGKKFNIPVAYNEEADKASWIEMKAFLESIF